MNPEKGLKQFKIKDRIKTIHATALLRSARFEEEQSWLYEDSCCHSNSSKSPQTKAGGKSSQ